MMRKRQPAITGVFCTDLGEEFTSEQVYEKTEKYLFERMPEETKELYGKLLLRTPDRVRKMMRSYEDILSTTEDGEARQREFERVALTLLEAAARGAMEQCGLGPEDIDIIVCNYMAGQTLPSLTAHVAGALGLRNDIYTVNIGDMGCSAGVASLDMAVRLLRDEKKPKRALVLSTEPVSNLFRASGDTGGVVGNTLFGEGSAAVILSTHREPALYTIEAQQRIHATDPDSLDAIKTVWGEGGPTIQLSQEIPKVAGKAVAANLKRLVPKFLRKRDKLKYLVTKKTPRWQKRIDRWALHPGGYSILKGMQGEFRLADADIGPSYQVFHERSNMSSPSIMYVLDNIEKQRPEPGERVLMMSFGSGFQVNSLVLRKGPRHVYPEARRSAIVAGGTSGIGLDAAKRLVAEGYRVFIGSRRVGDADADYERIEGATYLPLDIADAASVEAFVDAVWRQSYGVDALVVSSGVAPTPALQGAQSSEDIDRTVQTNLSGAMMLVNATVPKMRVKGKIILINSILGQIPLMGNAAYCASKAGLRHFAESLEVELKRAGRGVEVHSLFPAYVKTPMLEQVQASGKTFLKPVAPAVVTQSIAQLLGVGGRASNGDPFVVPRDKVVAGLYRRLPRTFKSALASL
ncbi:MAG: SDR family NAD(P)-dependent oxidoreductase [Myxococcota bacterium]